MSLKESLLWPLTVPYGAALRLRARAYSLGVLKQQHLPATVISVGNLTTGGTGKTPMVIWIAERLAAEGKSVGILTRGYRGETSSPSQSTSDEVQVMRARLGDRIPFGVGPDRFARGQELAKQGVEWFVLDDGFQHVQLARDVDIVLIDATNPFGGGRLLPAGRLREPKTALARADLIVITRSSHSPAVEAAVHRETDAPIFYAQAALDSVYSPSNQSRASQPDPRAQPLFAFCGIGNPQAFVADLRSWGFEIVGHRFFRDHHRYSPNDLQAIKVEARASGARGMVCTEKDRFNLPEFRPSLDLWVTAISLHIEREDDFWRTIMAMAASRRAARALLTKATP